MFWTWKKSSSVFIGLWRKQENRDSGAKAPGTINGCGKLVAALILTMLAGSVATVFPASAQAQSRLLIATTVLPSATVGLSYSAGIAVSGGTAPYMCSIAAGSLPSGLVMNACTISGRLTAASGSSFAVRVTDSSSPALSVSGPLKIALTAAPLAFESTYLTSGTVGSPYHGQISVLGGTAPYQCSVQGGSLPAGLVLNGCSLAGVPTVANSDYVTIRVTDSELPAASLSGVVNVTIKAGSKASSALVLAASMPNGAVGVPYRGSLSATGGSAPYTCSLAGGMMPAGLVLNGCSITGTPSVAGVGVVGLRLTDSASPANASSSNFSLVIAPGSLTVTAGSLSSGTVGRPYNSSIVITGGTAPYACSIASGTLPAGLALKGCSVLGTPTAAGTGALTVRVTDSSSPAAAASGAVTWTIAPPELALTTTGLANGIVGKRYASSVTATGGTAPYTCKVVGGLLPSGLMLSGCSVTGEPKAAGMGSVTVLVTDAENPAASVSGPVSWTVAPSVLTLITRNMLNGTVGSTYNHGFAITGGTAPYTCAALDPLPNGLALTGCSITGKPLTPGADSFRVQVTDASSPANSATGPMSLTVLAAGLKFATPSLPGGVVGAAYSAGIAIIGGTAPYHCSMSGGALPDGVALTGCSVTGVPTTAGTDSVTITVADSASPAKSVSEALALTVAPAKLALAQTSLPNGTAAVFYTSTLQAIGGTSPYRCSLASGTLPAGLSLNGCTVSGTPAAAATAALTVRITDAGSPALMASGPVSLLIAPATLTLASATLPAAMVGQPYAGALTAWGGTAPYTYSIAGGSLPPGLVLSPSGAITGTPTTPASASLTIVATDANRPQSDTASGLVTLTVNAGTMSLTTAQLAAPVLASPYSQTLGVVGGTAPYTFTIASGALPTGLTLSASGVVSGTPTAPGASSFTVAVVDSETTPQTATRIYVPLVLYPAGANNAQLSGSFAFLVQGYDPASDGDLPYQTATIGSFVADGSGLLKNGEMDSNHQSATMSGAAPSTHFIGSYEVGADDCGLLTITPLNSDGTTGPSSTFAIAASGEAPPDGSTAAAEIAAAGGSPMQAASAPGMLLMQDTTAFAQALAGSYAFGIKGDTPCLATCVLGVTGGPVAEVGEFATNGAGTITSGASDGNIGALANANATLTGQYGATDANGRLQMTMDTANTPAGLYPSTYAVYVVNANQALLMSIDPHATHVLLSGTAQLQTQSAFSNASMSGAVLGFENAMLSPAALGVSLASVSAAPTASIFRATATADGNCSISNVDLAGGTRLITTLSAMGSNTAEVSALLAARQATGLTTCPVAANGRGVLAAPQPSASVSGALGAAGLTPVATAPRVFYLVSPGRGYFLETGYAALGSFEPQSAGSFSNASLSGTYRFGTGAPSGASSTGRSGLVTANGDGTLGVTPDAGLDADGLSVSGASLAVSYSLTDAVAGRFSTSTTLFYALSPNRLLQLDVDPNTASPSIGTMQR